MSPSAEKDLGAIRGALVVPGLPMQLPEYAGQADAGGEIRERSVAALVEAIADWKPSAVVVVAGHDPLAEHTKGSVGARVARLLLTGAGWEGPVREISVPIDADPGELDGAAERVLEGRTATGALVLVPADLSAKRTEAAPGHFDERAAAFDAHVLDAIASGDAASLIRSDLVLAQDLWATGLAPLQVLARVLPAPVRSEIMWSALPWGVQYVRARWWGRKA